LLSANPRDYSSPAAVSLSIQAGIFVSVAVYYTPNRRLDYLFRLLDEYEIVYLAEM
jgi:hypothetical protein